MAKRLAHARTLPARLLLLSLLLPASICMADGAAFHESSRETEEVSAGGFSAGSAPDTIYHFFVGNLHSHTSYSDGVGTPAQAFAHARDTAGTDFLAVTDHHNQLTDSEYADVLAQADEYCEDGVFTAIGGQEWSGHDPVTGWANHVVVLDADHVFTAPEDDLEAFYDELSESGATGIFAHPGPGAFNDFAYSPIADSGIHAVEIRHAVYEPMFIEFLNNGWRLGVDGSQDNHDATWGEGPHWTVALACSLTREDILGAVENHRTYSTFDRNLELTFRAHGHWMGETFEHEDNILLSIGATDPDADDSIERIELYQNGLVVNWVTPDSNQCSWHPEITPPEGDNYYFVKIYEDDGEEAWSAPIWAGCRTDLPPTPTLHTPGDRDTLNTVTPTLVWHPSESATAYALQWSVSDSFPDDGSTVTVASVADTFYAVADDLELYAFYHWRVAAVNDSGSSTWSGTRWFYIGGIPLFSQDSEVRATTDPANDTCPSLALVGDDMWLAWCSLRDGNSELYFKTSPDGGVSWSGETRLTSDSEDDIGPAVAQDGSGRAWVSWESIRNGNWEIYCKSHDGVSWSDEDNLTENASADLGASMTQYADSLLWVVWSSDRRGANFEIYCMAFDGDSWSAETRLTHDNAHDSDPGIVDVNGQELWVVWATDRDGNREVYSKTFDGASWSEDSRLTWSSEDESSPAIARTADGMIWLTYTISGGVFYKTYQHGCWSAAAALPTGPCCGLPASDRPSVAQASDGRMWIAYDSSRDGNRDIYAQRSSHDMGVTWVPDITGDADVLPAFSLAQSYPNPLGAAARIQYELRRSARVGLRVYDLAGRLVRTLVSQESQTVGIHTVVWDGRGDRGRSVGPGVYFCRIDVGGEAATMKMVLVK
jgi:hypothetical protein